jgi:hypothetical protein
MKSPDLPVLQVRLNELAECYGSKAPTTGALRVWLDALIEVSLADVIAVLTDWPKTRAKPPMPSEVLTLARAAVSDRLERESRARVAEHAPTINEVIDQAARSASSEIAKREIAQMRAILQMGRLVRETRDGITDDELELARERDAIQSEGTR